VRREKGSVRMRIRVKGASAGAGFARLGLAPDCPMHRTVQGGWPGEQAGGAA